MSAEEKSFGSVLVRSSAAPLPRCEWPLNLCTTANEASATSTAGCGQNLERQRPITAAAHKLARIIFHLITTRQDFDDTPFATDQLRYAKRQENKLRVKAKAPASSSRQWNYEVVSFRRLRGSQTLFLMHNRTPAPCA
jgi:hypothetical protein